MPKRRRAKAPQARKALCVADDEDYNLFGLCVHDVRAEVLCYLDDTTVATMLLAPNPVRRVLLADNASALRRWLLRNTQDEDTGLRNLIRAAAALPVGSWVALPHVLALIKPDRDARIHHSALKYTLGKWRLSKDDYRRVAYYCNHGDEIAFALVAQDFHQNTRWEKVVNSMKPSRDGYFDHQLLFRLQLLLPLRFPFSVEMIANIAISIAKNKNAAAAALFLPYLGSPERRRMPVLDDADDIDLVYDNLIYAKEEEAVVFLLESGVAVPRCKGTGLVHTALGAHRNSMLKLLLAQPTIHLTCDCARNHSRPIRHLVAINNLPGTELVLASPKSDAAFASELLYSVDDSDFGEVAALLRADSRVRWAA